MEIKVKSKIANDNKTWIWIQHATQVKTGDCKTPNIAEEFMQFYTNLVSLLIENPKNELFVI
jgi:hypothetical protein